MHYLDDPDQLPELPDPGPRDGRHGVDRDEEYDPFPAVYSGTHLAEALLVSLDDAKRHITVLLGRAESGQEVVVMQHGTAIARIVPPSHRASPMQGAVDAPVVEEPGWRTTLHQPGTSPASSSAIAPAIALPPMIASVTRVESLDTVTGATVVGEIVVDSTGTLRALVLDDLDQLPALPDPGPRDGRHGVDRETDVEQPLRRPPGRSRPPRSP